MVCDQTEPAATPERFRHVLFEGQPRTPADPRHSVAPAPAIQWDGSPLAELPGTPYETHQFIRAVLQRSGLTQHHYRSRPLVRRVPACLRALDAQTLHAATAMVQADPGRHRLAADALLIGATEFFRDRKVFDSLALHVIPALARRRVVIDVWSVGCSDGAELYSIAMLLAQRNRWCTGKLLGTDCRPNAIARATAACYPRDSATGLPDGLAQRYLRPVGGGVVVADELRRMARWRVQNALAITDDACWDLVLCRNMAIYLDPQATGDLWTRLTRALRPGGVLVVGRAERPAATHLRRVEPCIYVKEEA